jgi:hypothetical protein
MPTRRHRAHAALAVLLLHAACTVGDPTGAGDGADVDAALADEPAATPGEVVRYDDPRLGDLTLIGFADSGATIVNPERGYYVGVNLLSTSSAAQVRAGGRTLGIALVKLDAYRGAPLDQAFLDRLDAGLNAVRAAGVKVILRFMYNSDGGADASRSRILGHLTQLRPLLARHADVISVMQAGFIGGWGEWHSSTNGLDNDADRAAILGAILDALPTNRSVQIRTPMFKERALPGGPLGVLEAFGETDRARVGHHNDCFLASSSDYGTYASPVDGWKGYVAQDTTFAPMGGETCKVNAPRTDCATAQAEMAMLHFSYLNSQYKVEVLNGWTAQGCGDAIAKRLGYRLSAASLTHSTSVAPGGELVVALDLANAGYAAPYNARPIYLVLRKGSVRHQVRLTAEDARTLQPGRSTLWARLRVPANLAAGDYDLAVWMPDAAPTLADDPRYAIQLANAGVWEAATGLNVLTRALRVDPNASGPRDAAATALVEL